LPCHVRERARTLLQNRREEEARQASPASDQLGSTPLTR
jgi:hypothetical protein